MTNRDPAAPAIPTTGRPSIGRPPRAQELPAGRSHPDREQILLAAVRFIDQHGVQELTTHKLAAQLDVPITAVSRWFRHRNELLDEIVETLVDELYADPEVSPATSDWQEYLQCVAHGVRRIALNHPRVFLLVATRPQSVPWVQPPLRSLRWMDTFLDTLHRCGFSDRAAVAAHRAFSSFLLGHLMLEVSALHAGVSSTDQPQVRPPQPEDLAAYPRLAALQNELTRNHPDDEFGESLESLLDRLEIQGIK